MALPHRLSWTRGCGPTGSLPLSRGIVRSALVTVALNIRSRCLWPSGERDPKPGPRSGRPFASGLGLRPRLAAGMDPGL